MTRLPSRSLVLSWATLLALLALTVWLAHLPLGSFNLWVAMAIAAAKVLIVAAVFMELREHSGLVIAFAVAGVAWLGVLLWLSGADYVTRAQFPS